MPSSPWGSPGHQFLMPFQSFLGILSTVAAVGRGVSGCLSRDTSRHERERETADAINSTYGADASVVVQ